MREIILIDRYDVTAIIKEQKELWVSNTLMLFGISSEDVASKRLAALAAQGIEVWDHLDNGDVEILQNNVLIAKWYNPQLIAKYDEKQNIYYEVQLDYESILDNEFHSAGEEK